MSPQSHRVHHSARPEHHDSKHGVLFSVWDRLLGTQNPDETSYPSTGVDDPEFPEVRSGRLVDLALAPIVQSVYPFRRIWRTRRRRGGRGSGDSTLGIP